MRLDGPFSADCDYTMPSDCKLFLEGNHFFTTPYDYVRCYRAPGYCTGGPISCPPMFPFHRLVSSRLLRELTVAFIALFDKTHPDRLSLSTFSAITRSPANRFSIYLPSSSDLSPPSYQALLPSGSPARCVGWTGVLSLTRPRAMPPDSEALTQATSLRSQLRLGLFVQHSDTHFRRMTYMVSKTSRHSQTPVAKDNQYPLRQTILTEATLLFRSQHPKIALCNGAQSDSRTHRKPREDTHYTGWAIFII
jgi:hypothetical protein